MRPRWVSKRNSVTRTDEAPRGTSLAPFIKFLGLHHPRDTGVDSSVKAGLRSRHRGSGARALTKLITPGQGFGWNGVQVGKTRACKASLFPWRSVSSPLPWG